MSPPSTSEHFRAKRGRRARASGARRPAREGASLVLWPLHGRNSVCPATFSHLQRAWILAPCSSLECSPHARVLATCSGSSTLDAPDTQCSTLDPRASSLDVHRAPLHAQDGRERAHRANVQTHISAPRLLASCFLPLYNFLLPHTYTHNNITTCNCTNNFPTLQLSNSARFAPFTSLSPFSSISCPVFIIMQLSFSCLRLS